MAQFGHVVDEQVDLEDAERCRELGEETQRDFEGLRANVYCVDGTVAGEAQGLSEECASGAAWPGDME